MNIQEFKKKLSSIVSIDDIGLNVFFLLNSDELVLKRANILEGVKDNLIEAYRSNLLSLIESEELSILNLSAADDRNNAIYLYDLDEEPSVFQHFREITNTLLNDGVTDLFNFQEDNLSNLEGYFVFLGNHENNILFYRKQMPVNLFKRGKIFLVKHNTSFDCIKEEFLRIDTKIDIMSLDNCVIVNNLKILERHYEFHNIITKRATDSIELIETLNLIDNIEILRERVDDITFARKLAKISTASPVFNFTKDHIMAFVRNHSILNREFKYNNDNSQILLHTKKSQNYFIKLMNDDFLHSKLTDYDYVTPAKDKLNAGE